MDNRKKASDLSYGQQLGEITGNDPQKINELKTLLKKYAPDIREFAGKNFNDK